MFHVKHPRPDAVAQYRELVHDYHKTLNLVSDKALADFDRHLEDATTYAALIAELSPAPATVLDLGSGVGLPGLVIALALPDTQVVLVERRRRRAAFLSLACGRLGATNAEVRTADVRAIEDVKAEVVTAQAVASFLEVYRLTCRVHMQEVVLISRKGSAWRDEMSSMDAALSTATAVVAEVPLGQRGTLVALRLAGGRACPP